MLTVKNHELLTNDIKEILFDENQIAEIVESLPYIADSEATTVAALREDFNSLLAVLRSNGLMKTEQLEATKD